MTEIEESIMRQRSKRITGDKTAEKILSFLRRSPTASVLEVSAGIDIPESTVCKRIAALRRAGRLSRGLYVVDPAGFNWYLVTVVPDLQQLQARRGSGGVRTLEEYGEHIFRLCWDEPRFKDTLLIRGIWQNQGGSLSQSGNMVDGMTFFIQAQNLAVVGDFKEFLIEAGSIRNFHFIALFPLSVVLLG